MCLVILPSKAVITLIWVWQWGVDRYVINLDPASPLEKGQRRQKRPMLQVGREDLIVLGLAANLNKAMAKPTGKYPFVRKYRPVGADELANWLPC